MKNNLVSIITPMYKGALFVGDAIESVQSQTYSDWEMIIVDDCSPDGGAGIEVVKRYTENDPRIVLIQSLENRGSSGARNIALRAAKGRYIAFLDSDDIWHPDFLEKQMSFMAAKNAALVFSSYRRIDEVSKNEILRPYIVPGLVTYKTLLRANPIFPSTVLYDGSKCEKLYFNEQWGSMRDDYIYLLAMLKNIGYAYGNAEILVDYRMRKSSATGDKRKVIVPQWRVLSQSEKLPFLKCVYYMCCWAFISFRKYRK